MELRSVTIPVSESIIFPGVEEARIMPIGDVQLDPKRRGRQRRAHTEKLRRAVEWGIANDCIFAGIGDMVDAISPSNRQSLRTSKVYDAWRDGMEEQGFEAIDELCELFKGTEGRWLGMVSGHHYWPFEDGQTTDQKLADAMGCDFLGDQGYVRVNLSGSKLRRIPTFKLSIWHGEGSGVTAAAPLNKLEKQVAGREADVFMMGHFHRAAGVKIPKLDMVGGELGGTPRLVERNRLLLATGSFMRSYQQGSKVEGRSGGSYVEKAGMPPAALGTVVAFARPFTVRNSNYVGVDHNYMTL
jgi:hypothetical protein